MTMMMYHRNCRTSLVFLATTLFFSACVRYVYVEASVVVPPMAARFTTKRVAPIAAPTTTATESVQKVALPEETQTSSESSTTSLNPILQLFSYVKDSVVNFKNGLSQMNTDHNRCNAIRAKQRKYAKDNCFARPRGAKGIQTGGISYEEYDFLKKGMVDRNKLFAVTMVALCLPNYFVYYLWSFPDMLPSPFIQAKDPREISRERCHAVISTLLDLEKGARVAPFASKLNPFGKKSTERAMERLKQFGDMGCIDFEEDGAIGPSGGKIILKKLKNELYTKAAPSKQRIMLAGNLIPKQIMKGIGKAISADPLSKGSSPFGVGLVKHLESVTLADEFLVEQKIDIDSIDSLLLEQACSARLIGGPGWTDEERKEGLLNWLEQTEILPKEESQNGAGYFNGNLARAALMCYHAVDGTRDSRADSRLLRVMYQGQMKDTAL
mmetsp:Transcript_5730/g.11782  ORF Transcript_5730/g.11782 Transcript_5730/m.11782 type:complete len:439 (+) Transcript_5730:82-1398(+)